MISINKLSKLPFPTGTFTFIFRKHILPLEDAIDETSRIQNTASQQNYISLHWRYSITYTFCLTQYLRNSICLKKHISFFFVFLDQGST